jgi:O-antigen ligase
MMFKGYQLSAVGKALIWGACFICVCVVGLTGTGVSPLFQIPSYLAVGLCALLVAAFVPARGPKWTDALIAIVFVGYLAGRAAFSDVVYLARTDLFLVALFYASYLCASRLPQTRPAYLALLLLVSFVALVHCGFALYQYRTGSNYLVWSVITDGVYVRTPQSGIFRAGGGFNAAPHLAAFLTTSVAFIASALVSRFGLVAKVFFGIVTLLVLMTCFLAVSKNILVSWPVIGLGCIMWILWKRNRIIGTNRTRFWLGALGVAGGFCLIVMVGWSVAGDGLIARIHEETKGHMGVSNSPRIGKYKTAMAQIQMSPWVGMGARSFTYLSRTLRDPEVPNWLGGEFVFVHSDLLQLIAEYGFIGLVLFLLLFGLSIRNSWGYRGWDDPAAPFGCFLCGIAFTVHFSIDFVGHLPAMVTVVGMVCGLVRMQDNQTATRVAVWADRMILALVGLFLMVGGLYFGRSELLVEEAKRIDNEEYYAPIAIALLDQAIEIDSSNFEAYRERGRRKLDLVGIATNEVDLERRLSTSLRDLTESLRLYPSDPFELKFVATVFSAAGRYGEAESLMRRACSVAPGYGVMWVDFGALLMETGKYLEAKSAYERASKCTQFRDFSWSSKIPELEKLLKERQLNGGG